MRRISCGGFGAPAVMPSPHGAQVHGLAGCARSVQSAEHVDKHRWGTF